MQNSSFITFLPQDKLTTVFWIFHLLLKLLGTSISAGYQYIIIFSPFPCPLQSLAFTCPNLSSLSANAERISMRSWSRLSCTVNKALFVFLNFRLPDCILKRLPRALLGIQQSVRNNIRSSSCPVTVPHQFSLNTSVICCAGWSQVTPDL